MDTTEEPAMSQCPHGSHTDHENRIKTLEGESKEHREAIAAMDKRIGSPALAVAIVSVFGVCFTACASFLAVVSAPIIQAALKNAGWM